MFNTPARTVLAVGLLALFANSQRLLLNDMGLMLAPAAFIAAFTIGLVTLVVDQHFTVPRIAMTVAPIVIMIPGLYAFDAIVLFNQGQALEGLGAAVRCGFIIGGLAMGLATARFFSPEKV
ncbi:MAG TPA: threonine/serine exporter family protein [Steroidobacteraceae bacterium]|nr:threonine/serine exporter family protein [Steroidobacteraceae bacterium]